MNTESPIGIGLVGLGRWGKTLLKAFSALADVKIACNRSNLNDHIWLQKHYRNTRPTLDVSEALRHPEVDAIVIATPIATHFPLVRRALEAGKHVFVEKPLATSAREADSLVKLAAREERRLFVGHTFLFHPVFDRLEVETNQDSIEWARFEWDKWGTFSEELVWNLLPHDVAIALALFRQQPTRVEVTESRGVRTPTDFLAVNLTFDGRNRECRIAVNRVAQVKRKRVNFATRSGLRLEWEADKLKLRGPAGWRTIFRSAEEPVLREVNAFLTSLREGKATRSDGGFGAKVTDVIEEIARQLRASETVG